MNADVTTGGAAAPSLSPPLSPSSLSLCFPQRKSNLIVVFLSTISCFSIHLSIYNIHDNTFLFIFIAAETFFAGDIFPYLHIFYIHIFRYNSYFIVYFIPPHTRVYACVHPSATACRFRGWMRRRRKGMSGGERHGARRKRGDTKAAARCACALPCACACVSGETHARRSAKRNRWKTDTRSRCSRRN